MVARVLPFQDRRSQRASKVARMRSSRIGSGQSSSSSSPCRATHRLTVTGSNFPARIRIGLFGQYRSHSSPRSAGGADRRSSAECLLSIAYVISCAG
jgi:hypothetical protein